LDEASLPTCFVITARTDEGEIMGIAHREFSLEGVQFHPESILTEHGKTLLSNFLEAA
jgi:anthranilate/para-aminobenzoate synthase component II